MLEPVAITERLELRQVTVGDAEGMFRLNSYPEAIRYTGDVAFASLDEARRFASDYQKVYKDDGFGRWSVYLRQGGEYLGFCGLRRGDDGRVDLGFRITPPHWGNGYATEASLASLEIGFERYRLPGVIARAMTENTASHRVLARLGFSRSGREQDRDGEWIVYQLDRRAFVGRARAGRPTTDDR